MLIRKFTIKLEVFFSELKIWITNENFNTVASKFLGAKLNEVGQHCSALMFYTGEDCKNEHKGKYFIFIKDEEDYIEFIGQLSHEILHFVNSIFEEKGIYYNNMEDEVLAYTHGYLLESALKMIRAREEKFFKNHGDTIKYFPHLYR